MATVTKPIALDESLNTTEQTPRNVADVLAQELARIAGRQASDVNYDNTDSGLTADNVQDAIDELKSDIPTVNDGTLTIQQNGEAKGTFTANQSGNSTVNIETPTTGIQTAVDEFSTYNGGLLSSLKVALSPNQDLHGYDSPWVGGAGKNKLPLVLADIKSLNTSGTWSGNVYTINGGTITIDTDVDGNVIDIKANDTFTARTVLFIARATDNYHPTSDSYIVNKSYQNAYTILNVDAYNNNTWVQSLAKSSSVDDVQFTIDYSGYDRLSIYLEISSGISANNIIFKPMIRLATESDPTFEPYSNICPISGHTQVEVDVSDGQTTQEQISVQIGQTVYGGTVGLVSGVMNVNNKSLTFDGTGSWWDGTTASYYQFNLVIGDTIKYNTIIANELRSITVSERGSKNGVIKDQQDNILRVSFTLTNTLGINSLSDFKTWLGNNNLQICYELTSPTTINLTPQQIVALVGENHLSAPLDGQEITESQYKQVFTFDDVIAYIQSLS